MKLQWIYNLQKNYQRYKRCDGQKVPTPEKLYGRFHIHISFIKNMSRKFKLNLFSRLGAVARKRNKMCALSIIRNISCKLEYISLDSLGAVARTRKVIIHLGHIT